MLDVIVYWQGIKEEQLRSLGEDVWDKIVVENVGLFLNKVLKKFMCKWIKVVRAFIIYCS